MPLFTNDHITLGTLIFTYNPQVYSVTTDKLATHRRTRDGTLVTQYIPAATAGDVKAKKEFSFGTFTKAQIEDIKTLFAKAANQTFIDPYGNTYTVQFIGPFEHIAEGGDNSRTKFTIKLMEV
jgi:hypothetical protein